MRGRSVPAVPPAGPQTFPWPDSPGVTSCSGHPRNTFHHNIHQSVSQRPRLHRTIYPIPLVNTIHPTSNYLLSSEWMFTLISRITDISTHQKCLGNSCSSNLQPCSSCPSWQSCLDNKVMTIMIESPLPPSPSHTSRHISYWGGYTSALHSSTR